MYMRDQRSFGIAHLGEKSSYFCRHAESQEEQLCLWLTRFQLCSQALGVCLCRSWFVKRQAGVNCHNSEMSFRYCSCGEVSPLVKKSLKKKKKPEIVNL